MATRAEASRGPDPVLIRIPRSGGTARAYLYPRLDSTIWTGHSTSVERVLGFDPEGGTLALLDARGEPARMDLRLGEANVASKLRLASITAPGGSDIFGVNDGTVVRLTRAGSWKFNPPSPARAAFPQPDGSVLIAAQTGAETTIWKVHPPDMRIRDTVRLPLTMRGIRAQVGDRVYFAADSTLVGVRARDMSVVTPIAVHGRVVALAPTPSGDRVYVATAGDSSVAVVDRYTDRVATRVRLPGEVSELRMDRLGRYVLARPVRGDSAWVIAVATNSVSGSARTRWTDDLPTAAPDGSIVVNTGRDVLLLDGETLQPVRSISGGGADYWYFLFWNGFRARPAGMDQPVTFASADSAPSDTLASRDTVSVAAGDSGMAGTAAGAVTAGAPQATRPAAARTPVASAPATSRPTPALPSQAAATPTAPATPAPAQARPAPDHGASGSPATSATAEAGPYTVSFAAMLTEDKARALADSIQVGGVKARVAPSHRGGTIIYRVVLGPYPSRAEAERIGHESGRSFWAFPGNP